MPVSVIIPAYGRADTLPRAIRSVRAQADPTVEIIVVDDGTPGGLTLAPEVAADVRIIRNDRNRGPGASRNLGASQATHDVLAFLDADDEWFPGSLQPRVDRLSLGACVVGGFCRVDDRNGHRETFHLPPALEEALVTSNPVVTCGIVVLRRDFERVGGFPDDRDCAEDWIFLLRLLKAGIRLEPVDDPVVVVHVDGANTTFRPETSARHALGALRHMEAEDLMHPAKIMLARRVVHARVAGFNANAGLIGQAVRHAGIALDGGFDTRVVHELLRIPVQAARGFARRARSR